jgi:tetratricopeptide (TPR) repeat protein
MRVYSLIIFFVVVSMVSFSCDRPQSNNGSERGAVPPPAEHRQINAPQSHIQPHGRNNPSATGVHDSIDPLNLAVSSSDPELAELGRLLQSARNTHDIAQFDLAEKLLRKNLETNPKDDRFWVLLGLLYNEKRYVHMPSASHPVTLTEGTEFLEKALELNPDSPSALFEMGRAHEIHGRFADAAQVFRKLLQSFPGNISVVTHLSRNLINSDSAGEAIRVLKSTLQHIATSTDTVQRAQDEAMIQELLGMAYMKVEETAQAEKVLKASIETTNRYGGPACAYFALGALYTETGRIDKAAGTLKDAADREPHNALLLKRAALALYQAGRLDEAKEYARRLVALKSEPEGRSIATRIEEAIDLRKEGGVPLLEKAIQQINQGRYEAAYREFRQTNPTRFDSRVSVIEGFIALFRRDYEQASESFKFAEGSKEQSFAAGVGFGHLALLDKRYEDAKKMFRPVVAEWGKHVLDSTQGGDFDRRYPWFIYRMACLGMGWSLSNEHRHAESIPYFDRLLSKTPEDSLALLGKANALTASGDLNQAEALLQIVLRKDPSNPYALAELGLVRLRNGDEPGAEKAFKDAASAGPEKYTCPFEGLGILYMKQGKLGSAKENFEKAIEMNPEIEYKKFNGLARIYIKEGRVDEAKKLLRQSIKNYPHDPEAKELLDGLKLSEENKPS